MRGDDALEKRDVVGIVDPRRCDLHVGGVAGRRERVGIGGDRERVLAEHADDVVALADAGQQDGRTLAHEASDGAWNCASVSARRPSRSVSSDSTSVGGTLPRFTSGP